MAEPRGMWGKKKIEFPAAQLSVCRKIRFIFKPKYNE